MAEIHVQPKKHQANPAWIWIVVVLLLVAVAVIFFLNRSNKTNENNTAGKNTTSYIHSQQPVYDDYVFVMQAA